MHFGAIEILQNVSVTYLTEKNLTPTTAHAAIVFMRYTYIAVGKRNTEADRQVRWRKRRQFL